MVTWCPWNVFDGCYEPPEDYVEWGSTQVTVTPGVAPTSPGRGTTTARRDGSPAWTPDTWGCTCTIRKRGMGTRTQATIRCDGWIQQERTIWSTSILENRSYSWGRTPTVRSGSPVMSA
jgi:hypothetical protein